MLRDMLKLEGFEVGRKHVRTLMDKMGIAALYRKRNTSAPHPAHRVYPYPTPAFFPERTNTGYGILRTTRDQEGSMMLTAGTSLRNHKNLS
jgi:hypothetical protein